MKTYLKLFKITYFNRIIDL